MTRRHSLVEALLGLAGLATLAFAFGAVAFALGLLIAEREREARIEGVCKALYHTTALSDAEMRKRAEEWFDEERAR